MADLTDLQAAQSIKIAGSSATGVETNAVNSSVNGDLFHQDLLQTSTSVQGTLTVGTSAVELKVGGSPLVSRKLATIDNSSSAIIYWGFTSGVTTSTGIRIFKDTQASWAVSETTKIYLIAGSAGNVTRIAEGA